ncbi:MAG: VOC family protein [Methyloceanibacter sp.]|uniref:VOC family protein n=1 Tax=Methyloceanibacter sp. TaxID=1965321 RepID=UPI003D9BEE36
MKMNPYLTFDGNCEEAFNFYASVLGGKIVAMMTHKDMPGDEQAPPDYADKILHARLIFGDNVLMASDAPKERFEKMQGMEVALNIADEAEAERVYAALLEGGTATMPLQETFWAKRFGMLTDRFGTPWMINCEKMA